MDPRNPRLAVEPDSQRDGFAEMVEQQGPKLLALCKHIVERGLNPAQRFIVIPDDDKNFIVLDANRRLTALRILERPELLLDRVSESAMKQLRQLSAQFSPPEDIPCIVFEKREDADPWIELLHQGESDGVGLVEWTAQQKARFRSRRGGSRLVHLQVLDFVGDSPTLSAETRQAISQERYPVSTLERVLMTPYVRKKLGVDVVDGRVTTSFPRQEVLKGLSRLVDDIGSKKIKVSDVMTIDDRRKYINRFKASELPDPGTEMEGSLALDAAPSKGPATSKTVDRKASRERKKVIPVEFSVEIEPVRINDIYQELKRKLKVNEVPNAVGALLRVFLELSVEHYMQTNKVAVQGKDQSLAAKVTAVVEHMVSIEAMTEKQAAPVREAVMRSPEKVSLATNLNALIHSPYMTVSGHDLIALWGRIEFFMRKLWTQEQT
jgi:hypothetical protein